MANTATHPGAPKKNELVLGSARKLPLFGVVLSDVVALLVSVMAVGVVLGDVVAEVVCDDVWLLVATSFVVTFL